MPPNIREEINKFSEEYYFIYQQFIWFVGLKYSGESEVSKLNFEYTVIEKDSRPENYLEIGNYYVNKIDGIFVNENYVPKEDTYETIIIKIDETTFDKLEIMINKITYMAYIESLKYGYNELNIDFNKIK